MDVRRAERRSMYVEILKANNGNDRVKLFTFWMILSASVVHVKSKMKSQCCGFSLKSLSFNESCLLNTVEMKLFLMSSTFSLSSKQFRQTMRFVGLVCDSRKFNMNVTLLALSASASVSDKASRARHRAISMELEIEQLKRVLK